MDEETTPEQGLAAASVLTSEAQRRYRLPRWYPIVSTVVLLAGVGLLVVGAIGGWFAPLAGTLLLTANVALFPLLLVSWRAQGAIPLDGRLASVRYWRVAPILVPATLIAASVVFLWAPAGQHWWALLVVVVPFAAEHVHRLRVWAGR